MTGDAGPADRRTTGTEPVGSAAEDPRPPAPDGVLPVGAAVRAVDVPVGTPMAGFAARGGPSLGTLDPLTVRAIRLGAAMVLAIDVCALHEDTCRRIRVGILDGDAGTQGRIGAPERPDLLTHVVVTATHTHSGPCCARGRLGPAQPELEDALVRAAIRTASEAAAATRPSSLEISRARGTRVAFDRRAGVPVDPPLTAVVARDETGRAHARLVHFSCHPVVIDGANRMIAGDYPAPLRERLDEDGAVTVFVTGCAGDVNTGHSAESSYSPGASDRTPTAARSVGHHLAAALHVAQPAPLAMSSSGTAVREVELDLDVPTPERTREQREAWSREQVTASTGRRELLTAWISWADDQLASPGEPVWRARVSAIAIGPLLLLCLPGEPFLATAETLERQLCGTAGVEHVVVLGYADGVPGYLPPYGQIPLGGYEVEDAHRYYAMPGPFAPGSVERLEGAVVEAAWEALRVPGPDSVGL